VSVCGGVLVKGSDDDSIAIAVNDISEGDWIKVNFETGEAVKCDPPRGRKRVSWTNLAELMGVIYAAWVMTSEGR